MTEPYYEDESNTIYLGDCREILLELGHVNAVVTDPPYGIDFGYNRHDDSRDNWYDLMDTAVPLMRSAADFVVLPSCGLDRLGWWYATHPPAWIIAWHKGSPGHQSPIGFNDWEALVVYGTPPNRSVHDHFQTRCGFTVPGHPCPKPIEWATWLVHRAAPEGGVVLDPFMGSGTTLIAAKQLGRRAIGIEISEEYCDLAVRRLAQGVLFPPLNPS